MNAFRDDLATLLARHIAAAPAPRLLRLVDQLNDDESKTSACNFVSAPRFIRLASNGTAWLDAQDGDHVAVRDYKTGLEWSAGTIGEADWEGAKKLCVDCKLLGKSDWRLPTVQELLTLVDYERWDPAIAPDFFRGPYGYTWSSTPRKGPSGCAWGVSTGGGYALWDGRLSRSHVRAVRAGQSLSLGL